MIAIPAIDIIDKKVVRLIKGDYSKKKVYSDNPVEVAKKWESEGAELLHIVDLDGALSGETKNLDVVKKIASEVSIQVELGGGIRDEESVKKALSTGVSRVILGTKACTDRDFVRSLVDKYGSKIVISIDAVAGIVYAEGWVKKTQLTAKDLIKEMEELGVKTLVYTDILRDGVMGGINTCLVKDILDAGKADMIISGGISSLDDIEALKNLHKKNLAGVIIGKALYEEAFTLREAIKVSSL